jgi:hypothetical protein
MLHAISTPTPTAQASTLFPSWLALISLLPARLSLSLSLSRFHGNSYTCSLAVSILRPPRPVLGLGTAASCQSFFLLLWQER